MERNIYLQAIRLDEAIKLAIAALERESLIRSELVPAEDCAGRVTAEPIFARFSSPTFHGAAMDGIAVKAQKTFGAREGHPLTLKEGEDFAYVNTGNLLPKFADAVIMIENVAKTGENTLSIEAPAFPWQHVRRIGEDIVATELLTPRGRTLTAHDVGALLSAGIWELKVWEKVKVHFIPTGDEVLDFTLRPIPRPGQVVESNSMMLGAIARSYGCLVSRCAPVPDDPEAVSQAVRQGLASGAHVVVVCAGSSAGSKDFTRQVFEDLGELILHGVAMMPGKPTLLAKAGGRLLFGCPGYPVSAAMSFEELAGPILQHLAHKDFSPRRKVEARLTRKFPSKLGMREFVRLAVGRVDGEVVATPLPRGAGLITSLTKAQGLTAIPEQSEGLDENAKIEVELLCEASEIERTLVVIGSHDNTIDLLADELMRLEAPLRLVSSHVGSLGGIMAIKSGSAHLAGTHLFDPASKDFNHPFLARHVPDCDAVLINLAIRHQGMLVAKGNPKHIVSIRDLGRADVTFINRQKGSGTRVLLDHHLLSLSLDPSRIKGYDKEEYTHMAVAVNVATGVADVGVGIYAAAMALGLDFLPLARERYDLMLLRKTLGDPKIEAVLGIIRSAEFQQKLRALGGYETTFSGRVMEPGFGLGQLST